MSIGLEGKAYCFAIFIPRRIGRIKLNDLTGPDELALKV